MELILILLSNILLLLMFTVEDWWFIEGNLTHSVENIAKHEIMENGPLTAAFYVKEEFIYYKSGVYIPNPNALYVDAHAVRVVGWGVEKGVKYWHVANSWDTDWGEEGFFKIIRGVNACYFEEMLTAVIPKMK